VILLVAGCPDPGVMPRQTSSSVPRTYVVTPPGAGESQGPAPPTAARTVLGG